MDIYYPQFPLSYQQKLSRYRRWQDVQVSLLGRLLLRQGLSQFYNYHLDFGEIQYAEYGKPFLPDNQLFFNISHSHELVACVIQKNAVVGIDVEYVRPVPINDFRSQMTENEWRTVSKAEDVIQAFYDYWSSKEAILKVEGSGVQLGLKTFEVSKDRKTTLVKNKTWHLKKCEPDTNYCCYVASAEIIEDTPIVCQFSF